MKLEIFTHTQRYSEPAPMGFEFLVIDTDTGFPETNFTMGTFKTRKAAEAWIAKHLKNLGVLALAEHAKERKDQQ
jgi:hypothetical protein